MAQQDPRFVAERKGLVAAAATAKAAASARAAVSVLSAATLSAHKTHTKTHKKKEENGDSRHGRAMTSRNGGYTVGGLYPTNGSRNVSKLSSVLGGFGIWVGITKAKTPFEQHAQTNTAVRYHSHGGRMRLKIVWSRSHLRNASKISLLFRELLFWVSAIRRKRL